MKKMHKSVVIGVALLCLSSPVLAAVQLTQVVGGLASPIFVGHAGDGSNRLFIVEQGGKIKVLQPGSSTPTDPPFLDITTKVVSGGERGLLGLAFHPNYQMNGRFFVYYTRSGDGALTIAEYLASPADSNQVEPTTEKILLTILHPTNANHNGGMLAFGPDGFLYIGVGDGGAGNDPPNNAQNKNVLLGKILRIDINPPPGPAGYVSPSSNPFFGAIDGADEIFAYGMRNPWRFSFDRITGQQWVADVGQGSREEVDTPIANGGNYGWRVYEGSACTGTDPTLCNPAIYIFPIFDYLHSGGRCSITGGYAYEGSVGTFAQGTYIYGDYCSGEIFTWNGSTQSVLLDTTLNISSFGEDELGEVYVVGLGGTVSKFVSTTPCTYSLTPTSQSVGANGASGQSVAVTAGSGCGWTAVSNATWIQVTSGASGTGNGTVGYSVDANTSSSARTGTMTIGGQTFTVNQSGAAACTFSISPTRATFPAAGGGGSVTLTTGAGCAWTAASNASWITITNATSGSGNATINYSVAAYTGRPKNRNGTMTIAGQNFSVKQSK